jgi:hypothetical protein
LTKGLMVFQTPLGAAACCLASAMSSPLLRPRPAGEIWPGWERGSEGDASEEGRWWRRPRSLVPLRFLLLPMTKATRADNNRKIIISGKILLARKAASRSRERRHGCARGRGVGTEAVGDFGRVTDRWATGLEEVGEENALCCWWCMGHWDGSVEIGSWDLVDGPNWGTEKRTLGSRPIVLWPLRRCLQKSGLN